MRLICFNTKAGTKNRYEKKKNVMELDMFCPVDNSAPSQMCVLACTPKYHAKSWCGSHCIEMMSFVKEGPKALMLKGLLDFWHMSRLMLLGHVRGVRSVPQEAGQ